MSGLTHLEMSSFMAYRLKWIYRNVDNHEHQKTRKNQNITEAKNKRKRNSRVVSVIGQRQAMNEQLRALNPVLLEPDQFTASHSR